MELHETTILDTLLKLKVFWSNNEERVTGLCSALVFMCIKDNNVDADEVALTIKYIHDNPPSKSLYKFMNPKSLYHFKPYTKKGRTKYLDKLIAYLASKSIKV